MLIGTKKRFSTLAARPELFEIFVVFHQEVRSVEPIGAVFDTMVAVEAAVDFFHLVEPFLGQVDTVRGTAQEERHAVAILYLDSCGARLAIAATTTEVATKFATVFFNTCTHLVREHRRIVLIGEPFVEFTFALDTPDGGHVVILGQWR